MLINPGGAPDTGDEILELQVCPAGGLARCYTVQPIVRGSFEWLATGLTGNAAHPAALVDGDRESSYGRDSFGRERPRSHPCP